MHSGEIGMQRNRLRTSRADFQYFLHAWRRDPATGTHRRSELIGTDGRRVRALRSRGTFVTFEQVEEPDIARGIVDTIECEWQPEAPFFGYESLVDAEKVAILSNGPEADEQWAVIPCPERDFQTGELMESAVTGRDAMRRHLIGGARLAWRSGQPYVEQAVEVRSWRKGEAGEGLDLHEHVEQWELRATIDKEGSPREIGLVPESCRQKEPRHGEHGRLETSVPLDKVIFQNFVDDSSFQTWFVLQFDRELLSVPENWRRFWMAVELQG